MAEWVTIVGGTTPTKRLKVDGGYLYRFGDGLCFAPSARVVPPPLETHGAAAGAGALPRLHRSAGDVKAPYRPYQPVDAEFEEVPAHEVNGSKVTDLVER